jgi:hypothetical protein
MRWVLVNNKNAALQEYHLMDNDECKVVLKYNPRHQSSRISSGSHQRLFFNESTGSLTGKTIFKNEYGIEIGSFVTEKWNNMEGIVTIEQKKYRYHLQNNPQIELLIYDSNLQSPLASCKPNPDNGNTQIALVNTGINNSCLLLGLCWYLSLPVAKERAIEYAA